MLLPACTGAAAVRCKEATCTVKDRGREGPAGPQQAQQAGVSPQLACRQHPPRCQSNPCVGATLLCPVGVASIWSYIGAADAECTIASVAVLPLAVVVVR